MKTSIAFLVLLSCIVLAASDIVPIPRDDHCASTCLWAGVYNFPSFQSCTKFLHCVHGFQFEMDCGPGEEFDHLTLMCQPADEGRCVLEGPITSSEETSEGTSEETSEEV